MVREADGSASLRAGVGEVETLTSWNGGCCVDGLGRGSCGHGLRCTDGSDCDLERLVSSQTS